MNPLSGIINAVGSGLDKLFTSDEERATAQITLKQLEQQPHLMQALINQAEAQHKNIFVAGWRPFIGWVCGLSIAYEYILQPILHAFHLPAIPIETGALYPLIFGMLGLGGMRTLDKIKGTTSTYNKVILPPPV